MELQKAESKDLLIRLKDKIIVYPEFKQSLQSICYNIGIREAIDATDMDSIFLYLSKYYGLLNVKQINEAFDLYSAQELEFKDSHYNSFDKTFIGKVLKSYQEYNKKEAVKPKLLTANNPNPTGSEERERAFYWVKFNFLDERKLNGFAREFKDGVFCSWKDAYLYMVEKGMLTELTGDKLQARLKEVDAISRAEETNEKKRKANAMRSEMLKTFNKTMLFYKFEVMDYFILNSQRI